MESHHHLHILLTCLHFASVTIPGSSVCIYPTGHYHGMCVTCPANTLYKDVPFWYPQDTFCEERCTEATPLIFGRKCERTCETGIEERQRGDVRYCRDKNFNKGFCPVNRCPTAFVCYFMECFQRCPIFTVQYNNSCLIECFEDHPLVYNGTCVKECPSEEHVIENGLCLTHCSKGLYLSGKKCKTSCPENQYTEGNTCVSNCSTFMKLEGRHCVNNCSHDRYVSGNKCVTHCPVGQYSHERQCVDSCPQNTVTEEKKCLAKCSPGRFLSDTICLANCPNGQFINQSNNVCIVQCNDGYMFQNGNFRFCLQSCPPQTAHINVSCERECPIAEPFYHDGYCHQNCPNSSSFILKETSSFNALLYRCVSSCSKYVSLNNLCVDMCQTYEVLYANTCLLHCPKSYPFPVHLPINDKERVNITSSFTLKEPISAFVICASKCPHNFVMDSGECYADCSNSSRKMIFNSTCLEECPNDHPYMIKNRSRILCSASCEHQRFNMNCVENCPSSHKSVFKSECVNCIEIGMFEQGEECVNKCANLVYQNKCYDYCPSSAHFRHNKTCYRACPQNVSLVDEQYDGIKKHFVCVKSCPVFKYVLGYQCVLKCPQDKRYNFEGKCVSCRDIGKFDDGGKCVDVCPEIGFNFRCMKQCPSSRILYKNSCVVTCPSDLPVRLYDRNKGSYCVSKCPPNMVLFNNNCADDCFEYVIDSRRYLYNDTCMAKCPPQAPYIKTFQKFSKNMYKCVEECEQGQMKLNNKCFDSCPPKYLVFDGNCVVNCPQKYPFRYKRHCVKNCSYFSLGLNCVDDCPTNLYRDNGSCVVMCPAYRPYEYHRECVENCKNNTFQKDKSCYDTCPSGSFGYRDKCLLNCPTDAKYSHSGLCKERCPNTTITFNYTCISRCPYYKVEFQRQCINACPESAPYINEGICVSSCPFAKLGRDCYEVCPKEMKAYEKECVERCPEHSSFIHNKNCVKRCPSYYINLNCVDKCPENTYPHGKECKSDCPKETPFLKDKIYEKKCLASCDSFELAAENMTCMFKSDCKGYIDDFWCRKKCLSHKYIMISSDKKYCESLYPVYIFSGIFLFIFIIIVLFGIRIVVYIGRIRKENEKGKEAYLEFGEINGAFEDDNDD